MFYRVVIRELIGSLFFCFWGTREKALLQKSGAGVKKGATKEKTLPHEKIFFGVHPKKALPKKKQMVIGEQKSGILC